MLGLVLALTLAWPPIAKAWLICNCVAQQSFQAKADEAEKLVIEGGRRFFEAKHQYAKALVQLEAGSLEQSLLPLAQAIDALGISIRLTQTVLQIGKQVGIKPSYIQGLMAVNYEQLGLELKANPGIWQVITQLGRRGDVLGFFKEALHRLNQNRELLEELYGIVASGQLPSVTILDQVTNSFHDTTLFGIYTSTLANRVASCQ